MSDERDPRVDPRPGDKVWLPGVGTFTVKILRAQTVVSRSSLDPDRDVAGTIAEWRGYMADARVVARGQEDRDGS